MKPFGLILAGGAARRIGGGDKTRFEIGGRTILDRILDRLAAQCDGVAISAPDGAQWPLPPELVLPDSIPDRPGPLAGVLAGLSFLEHRGKPEQLLLTVPGDAPFLPADLAERLSRARETADSATAVAASNGRLHHVTALWPQAQRSRLEAYVAEGRRSVGGFHDLVGTAAAVWPAVPLDPFFNVNTPADLTRADHLARTFGL